MDGPEFGVEHLVGAFFGALFVVLNTGLLGVVGHLVAAVLAVAAALVVVAAYVRSRRSAGSSGPAGMFAMTRSYRVIVVLEVVALVVGIAVLGRLAPQLNVPWIVLVVGVHFLAFVRWWPEGTAAAAGGGDGGARTFVFLGVVMVVLAVAGGVVGIVGGAPAGDLARFVSGALTGVVMLVGLTVPAVRRVRA